MNKERPPSSLDELPILTEVVVPSPVSVKAPANGIASAPASTLPKTAAAPQPATAATAAGTRSQPPISPMPKAAPTMDGNSLAAFPFSADMQETLIETIQQQTASEIPSLVEAALQKALPAITHEILEGLEASLRQTLNRLLTEIREKSRAAKY